VYDMAEWNRLYSPKDKSPDPLHEPKLNGLEFNPDYFQVAANYRLTIRFTELPPTPKNAPRNTAKVPPIKVTVKAIDARGKTTESKYPR
jgi:hypothetical protein